jgi:integrase/recombinase XerC
MDSDLKPHSVHVHYRNLKTFFNWLVEDGVLKDNPMKHIKPPKLPRLVIKPFSRQDIDNILLVCSGATFKDVRNMAIVLILLDTGIRLLELSGLKLSDINSDGDILTVYGKGSKERRVHLGLRAQRALGKYMMMRGDEGVKLWLTRSKKPITRDGLQIVVRRIIERAKITDTKGGPHTFRHTAAINFIRNGGNVYVLQEMLGHASQEMTRKYCSSIGIDDVVEAHKKFSPVDNLKLK